MAMQTDLGGVNHGVVYLVYKTVSMNETLSLGL